MSKAREEWNDEHSKKDIQSDIEDQIAAARREWMKNQNDELERRLSNAIQEVRRIWDEEQKLKTKEVRNQRVVLSIAVFMTCRRGVFQLFNLSRVAVLYMVVYVIYQLQSPTVCLVYCETNCIILSFLSLKKGSSGFATCITKNAFANKMIKTEKAWRAQFSLLFSENSLHMFHCKSCFIVVIIHMKKIFDSDWPRAVQFMCNTRAKSVTPVQIAHRNSRL